MEGNLELPKLSRTVSHALRHEPWVYGLELDSYGWVHLIDLEMSVQPPAVLFHGTSSGFLEQIKHEALKPKGRHYVHLSVDQETALLVAKRKQGMPSIITVRARKAYQNGLKFYQGNKTTWLVDYVSPDYLNVGTNL